MRKLYVILLFFSLLFSISCNSYKYGANAEPTQKSNLTFGVVKSKIIKGNTTQSEILEIFGAPNLVSKNKSNNEVWSYNKMSVVNKQGGTDFLFGARASQSSSIQSFDLIIYPMKRYILFLPILFILTSCGVSQKVLSPTEIKMMTTKQFEANYDLVFSSAISLLQSEGFLINNTDKTTGLITANKQIDNKNAGLQMFLIGTATEASTSQASFFIQALNDELTEVKFTLYEGSVSSSYNQYSGKSTTNKNSMVEDATIYANWFNNLRSEIERRKALIQ